MAGLAREGARLAAEVRIKYVDSQADTTQRMTEGIMPIVNNGHARMIFVRSRGIRLFYAPLSSAELEHSTTVSVQDRIALGVQKGAVRCA
jgi:hypothetical protein